MSVQSSTTAAKPAEPPKQSAPAQPWVATGLTYYHNQYVQRAADLGCCGVTHLLIFEDSHPAAKVGKIAVFIIVSIGFAMYDVLHFVYEKITGNHHVTAIPAAPANNASNASSSSAASAENPAKSKDAKSKEGVKIEVVEDDEDTETDGSKSVDLSKLVNKFNLENPEEVAASITANHELLKAAIEDLREKIDNRPEKGVMVGAINQLAKELSKQNDEIGRRILQDNAIIQGLEVEVAKMSKQAAILQQQMGGVMNITCAMDPELAKKIEEQVKAAEAKDKKAAGKEEAAKKSGGEPKSKPEPKKDESASKPAPTKPAPSAGKGSEKPEAKGAGPDDSGDEAVVPPSGLSSVVPILPKQPSSLLGAEAIYKELFEQTVQVGRKLGVPEYEIENNCKANQNTTYESETTRLGALKRTWTERLLNLLTGILHEVHGIAGISTIELLKNLDRSYPLYDDRLKYLDEVVEQTYPVARKKLWADILYKAQQLSMDADIVCMDAGKQDSQIALLRYYKKANAWLDGELAKAQSAKPPAPVPVPTPVGPPAGASPVNPADASGTPPSAS